MRQLLFIFGGITIVAAALVIAALFVQPPTHVRAASQFATILCDNFKAVSTGAATVQVFTAGNANMYIYVCNMSFGSIAGSSFSVIEGTGTTCGTNTLAMAGGTTAAAGYGIAANGSPVSVGGGVGAIMKTAVAGDNVCIITAGTGPLAGTMAATQMSF